MTQRLTAVFFLFVALVCGDSLVLRNGSMVKGVWMGVDGEKVRLLVDNQVQAYARADVATVTFGEDAPPAATVKADVEPAASGIVHVRDSAGKLIPLEKLSGRQTKTRTETFTEVEGKQSPVRLKTGEKMVFVVRLEEPNEKNAKAYVLVALEAYKDGNRRTQHPEGTPRGWSRVLPTEATRVSEFSYSFTPKKDLPPGEYAFIRAGAGDREYQCFGVE